MNSIENYSYQQEHYYCKYLNQTTREDIYMETIEVLTLA